MNIITPCSMPWLSSFVDVVPWLMCWNHQWIMDLTGDLCCTQTAVLHHFNTGNHVWATIRRLVKQYFLQTLGGLSAVLLLRGSCDWWNPDSSQGIERSEETERTGIPPEINIKRGVWKLTSVPYFAKENLHVSNMVFLLNMKMWKSD